MDQEPHSPVSLLKQLTGTIPTFEFAYNLYHLALYNNKLTGTLDNFNFRNQTQLELVQLNSNRLTGSLPKGFGVNKNLRFLDVGLNRLNGTIPADLGNASSLEYLNLYGNNFHGTVPPSLGNLTLLKGLDIRKNQLTHLPEAIVPVLKRAFYYNHTRLGLNPWKCPIPAFPYTNP